MLGTYIGGSGWDLVEEVVEADGALEDAMEERACGVLGAVPEVFHHVVARVVLAAVEQRHRRVEPTTSRRRRRRILVLVVGRRALASRREEAAAAAEVGVAGPAASAAVQAVYVRRRGTGGAQLSRWWSQTGRERRRGRGHHGGGGGGREAGVDARRRAGHGDGMQGSLGASRRVLSCRVWPPYHWLAAESAKYLASRAVFYFYIFYFRFLQKYIFDLEIYRNIPPGSAAVGAFLKKNSRRKLRAGPWGPVARQRRFTRLLVRAGTSAP